MTTPASSIQDRIAALRALPGTDVEVPHQSRVGEPDDLVVSQDNDADPLPDVAISFRNEDQPIPFVSDTVELLKDFYIVFPHNGVEVKLQRIRALKDFKARYREIKAGELGGWVQEGVVLRDSWVADNARVWGHVELDTTCIEDDTTVRNDRANTRLVLFDSTLCQKSQVVIHQDNDRMDNSYFAVNRAHLRGNAHLYPTNDISFQQSGHSLTTIGGHRVFGSVEQLDHVANNLTGRDIFTASSVGTECGKLVMHFNDQMQLRVSRGCFSGTVEEFLDASAVRHESGQRGTYAALIAAGIEQLYLNISRNTGGRFPESFGSFDEYVTAVFQHRQRGVKNQHKESAFKLEGPARELYLRALGIALRCGLVGNGISDQELDQMLIEPPKPTPYDHGEVAVADELRYGRGRLLNPGLTAI